VARADCDFFPRRELLAFVCSMVVPDLMTVSNPARSGAGFGDNSFSDHRTIHLMKLIVSTMLSAAIKMQ